MRRWAGESPLPPYPVLAIRIKFRMDIMNLKNQNGRMMRADGTKKIKFRIRLLCNPKGSTLQFVSLASLRCGFLPKPKLAF